MRGRSDFVMVAVAAALAVGCGPAERPASCPTDLPAACPTPAPSFAAEVSTIYRTKCQACHAPGGQEAAKPYTTLAQIQAEPLSTMLSQVYNCVMPLATAPQLTTDERQALLGWLVCREPDN